ncbi:FadR/GntR family transcriptional regulator [Streptomyces sp. NPDC020917]|uniref:FadR/GntR family transcriptional regulator n=1 Tax=Streptomyces sp. NPDC020917 TaxID=3365102 RepID=UPI0037A3C485
MTGLTSSQPNAPLSGADVAAAMETRLLSGEWGVGTRLPSERLLALEYQVSRPVIREALRALQERGLITVSAGRGSFVRDLRPSSHGGDATLLARRGEVTARDLVVARVMLEGQTAALAAQNRTEDDLTDMRRILAAFDREKSLAATADLDVAFHESIAVASRNPVIQLMFGSIRPLTHGVVLRSLTDRAVRGIAVPLHDVVFEAIADQDPDAARAAMTDHIETAQHFYGPDLDAPLTDVLIRRATSSPDLAEVLRTHRAILPDHND